MKNVRNKRDRIDEDKYGTIQNQIAENSGHFETTTTGEC